MSCQDKISRLGSVVLMVVTSRLREIKQRYFNIWSIIWYWYDPYDTLAYVHVHICMFAGTRTLSKLLVLWDFPLRVERGPCLHICMTRGLISPYYLQFVSDLSVFISWIYFQFVQTEVIVGVGRYSRNISTPYKHFYQDMDRQTQMTFLSALHSNLHQIFLRTSIFANKYSDVR